MTDSDHIMQLRQQVANLHASQVKARAERDQAVYEIERLRGMLEVQDEMVKHYVQERDDARRQVCELLVEGGCVTVEQVARERGWDCCKESSKEKYNLFLKDNEELERQIDEANAEVAHTKEIRQQVADLRALLAEALAQRDEAKSKIERIMEGLEGCCMTCEPVGIRNQQMERDIKTLQDQRDEARREVCKCNSTSYPHDMKEAYEIAELRGWHCFKDEHGRSS